MTTTNTNRESARIYAFPVRARDVSSRVASREGKVMSLPSRRAANVLATSGWYHEAAMQEAERDRRA